MKILKAIGGFFVRIWRWIKNTAWVQPLLIVGAIFGVIFSIPAITNGIRGIIEYNESANKFYASFQLSMEGEKSSAAYKLIDPLYDEIKLEHKSGDADKPWEKFNADQQKYFLLFTNTNNSTTNGWKDAFVALKDNWGSTYIPKVDDSGVGKNFKLYTIFTDESTSATTTVQTAFSKFLDAESAFFEKAGDQLKKSWYCFNEGVKKEDIDTFISSESTTFKTPTLLLIDWSKAGNSADTTLYDGVKTIMFDLPGDDCYKQAQTLIDCWNGADKFGEKINS